MLIDEVGLQTFRDLDDPGLSAQVSVEAARGLAQQGDLDEAARLLRATVRVEPACTEAWLGLAWLAESPQEREGLLRHVLMLDPEHPKARAELARLDPSESPSAPPGSWRGSRGRRWLWGLLVLPVGLVLAAFLVWGPVHSSLAWLLPTPTPTAAPTPTLTPEEIAAQFVPQLQAALSGEAWDRALELVTIMASVDPSGEGVQQWTLETYMTYGQALVLSGDVDGALVQFDHAVRVAPGDADAHLWQETAQTYLVGSEALEAGGWDAAINAFTQIHEAMPGFGDEDARLTEAYFRRGQEAVEAEDWTLAIESLSVVRERATWHADAVDLLAQAYRERGIEWEENNKLNKARTDLEAALDLRAHDARAQKYLDKVMYRLFPPKRIEIDISEQRLYAWEGDALVYEYRVSTGLRGRDTAPGNYQVLDKIPMAYSSIWRLKMPNWLGIYYVGGIENGIHALPIRPDGTVMWGGLLGQRASYGCVILSNKAAQTIYNWAKIGTVVDIHN
jgi:tetratricopeptide (TPR) repeat protein